MGASPSLTAPPTFVEAVRTWAKIGVLGFGGPAGQIALMHRIVVDEKGWISETRFLHALNYCMLLPGPEAQQLAIYIGWLLHGTRGGIAAGTLFVLPGFVVILTLSILYATFQDTGWLASLFFGLKAAVLAIVIEALLRVGKRALRTPFERFIAAAAFLAIYAVHVPFPIIVLGAGILGAIAARLSSRRRGEERGGEHTRSLAESVAEAQEILDVGEQPSSGVVRAARVIVVWGGLWLLPYVLLGVFAGWENVFPSLAAFFSKMAVVTFGGAYAVLAYVAQEAVNTFGWLQPGEMVDGLALAETTPGPLILVLVFVGFMAAFRHPGLLLDPLTSGVIGAVVTTWVTFVPCFLWIFLGAPYVEQLRGKQVLSGALKAITAAVVGVILNLALWFGLHVIFWEVAAVSWGALSPALPVVTSLDPWAAGLSLIAVAALFLAKIGMIRTLALCAALGLALRFIA